MYNPRYRRSGVPLPCVHHVHMYLRLGPRHLADIFVLRLYLLTRLVWESVCDLLPSVFSPYIHLEGMGSSLVR